MKKLLAMVLAIAMSLSLAACGGSPGAGSSSQSGAGLFGHALDAGHLLLKLILVYHQVQANLTYTVCHLYHLPFKLKAGAGSLLFWCGSRLCPLYIQLIDCFTARALNFSFYIFCKEKSLPASLTLYFLNCNHLHKWQQASAPTPPFPFRMLLGLS